MMRVWKKKPRVPARAVAVAVAVPALADAGAIRWGVSQQGIGDFDLYSDGSPILEGTFTYELGVFLSEGTAATFSPTVQNTRLWPSSWMPVGDASVLDPFTGTYGGTVESSAFAGIPTGSQVYIWGYSSREIGEGLEWVLFTGASPGVPAPSDDSWRSPEPAGAVPSPLEWAPRTATEAVVGRVASTPPGGAGGTVTFPAALAENVIQTAAVPEPSAGVLLALSAVPFFLRRARRRTLPESR